MMHGEASAAWRLFTHNWIPVGFMAVALALGLTLTGFSLKLASMLLPLGAVALLAGAAYAIASRRYSRLPFVLGTTAQLGLITALTTPVIYIAAAANLPMQDANLANLDRMLGFDWPAYFHFIYDRPALVPFAIFSYAMIGWPMFGVPIVLGATRHYRRLQQFSLACMLALITTTIISTLLPAIGTFHEYGIAFDPLKFNPGNYLIQVHDLPLLRDGSLRVLDLMKLGGIITFPSFHAAAAVLYLWALWSVWWMRPVALIANIGMLLATPMVGGHYFVDVFAGIGVAVLAIAAARWIYHRLIEGAARPALATVPPAAAVPAE